MRLSRFAALGLCLILAACGAPPRTAPPVMVAPPKVTTPPDGEGAVVPIAPMPSVAEIKADPTRLKGVRVSDIQSLLGAPHFLRREKPAEVWQYYGEGCVLDLFVYGNGADKNVAHVELRAKGSAQAPDARCLQGLIDNRQAPTS